MAKRKTNDTKVAMFVYDEAMRPYLKMVEDEDGHIFVFQLSQPHRPTPQNVLIWAEQALQTQPISPSSIARWYIRANGSV